jgi:rhodanese-related sulfurtransferase
MSISTITPQKLAEAAKNGSVEQIDVRTPAEFAAVHVAYARSVPLEKLDPKAIVAERNGRGGPLYVICHSGTRGKQACEQFLAAGFPDAVVVEGGTQACIAAGLPMKHGRQVLPLDRQMRIVMGTLVLIGVALGFLVHPVGFGLSAFVGCGLIFAGITDICPLSMLVARMPWNQRAPTCTAW